MQARLEVRRFPTIIVAFAFALAAALLLGGALGYFVKSGAITTTIAPAKVIVLSGGSAGDNSNDCVYIHHQKAC